MTREQLQASLQGALASPIDGAVIATRDGLPALVALPPSVDADSITAMAAAALAAAETALAVLDDTGDVQVDARGQGHRICIRGLDADSVLIAFAPAGADDGAFVEAVEQLVLAMRKALS